MVMSSLGGTDLLPGGGGSNSGSSTNVVPQIHTEQARTQDFGRATKKNTFFVASLNIYDIFGIGLIEIDLGGNGTFIRR